LIERIRLPIRL